MVTLPFLETMITQACNLSCHGCTNYSDLKHRGYVSWAEGKKQLEAWLTKINIPDFGIIGGEPLINPEVKDWLIGVRELLPDSQIRFTTNGELLSKNFELVDLAHSLGNVVFKITVHRQTPEIEKVIDRIYELYNWQEINEYGIDRLVTTNNFRFQVNRPTIFVKTYKNMYHDMEPHNSDPVDAFALCVQQKCPLLYKGRIYKCSTAGLLEETLNRFGWPHKEKWISYIDRGISPIDSDKTIQDFVSNFGHPNAICGQCPAAVHKESIIDHYSTTVSK